mgnify:FL=1
MNLKFIQKITTEEYDGNLTDYQNNLKLYERLNKELKGLDRVFLKILKNDIKELELKNDNAYYLGRYYDLQKEESNHRRYK